MNPLEWTILTTSAIFTSILFMYVIAIFYIYWPSIKKILSDREFWKFYKEEYVEYDLERIKTAANKLGGVKKFYN